MFEGSIQYLLRLSVESWLMRWCSEWYRALACGITCRCAVIGYSSNVVNEDDEGGDAATRLGLRGYTQRLRNFSGA